MTTPISFIVTSNILNVFLPCRKLKHVIQETLEETDRKIELDEVITIMENNEHLIINTVRQFPEDPEDPQKNWVPIMLLHPKQSLEFGSQTIRLHINNIIQVHPKRLDELIIIASDRFFSKSNLNKVIIQFRKSGIKVTTYDINRFAIPNSVSRPVHEILEPEEAEYVLSVLVNKPRVMLTSDAANVWLGGKPGQVVKVTRKSEITGMAIDYMVIKPG